MHVRKRRWSQHLRQIQGAALALAAGVVLVFCAQCAQPWRAVPGSAGADGVTAASHRRGAESASESSSDETYKVLGPKNGLRGDVVRYSERLYRGGRIESREGVETLKQLGVKTIVSLAPDDDERDWVREAGLELIEIPVEKSRGILRTDVEKLGETLESKPGKFYVHCAGGVHRGGAMCAAYRVRVQGWDADKAVREFEDLGGDAEADRKLLAPLE